ncbi:MAG: GDSL-type esterase/lipase family protein [Christensenellales bacterium]
MGRRHKAKTQHKIFTSRNITIVVVLLVLIMFMAGISIFSIAYNIYGNAMFSKDFIKDAKAKRYAYLNQTAQSEQIVFLGDSITEMYDLNYYYPDANIYNRGISGDTTSRMLVRLESNVLNIKPKAIFILGGCNDLRQGVSPEDIAVNLTKILHLIREELPDTQIFVQTVYPVNRTVKLAGKDLIGPYLTDDNVILLNEYISQVCAIYQVELIDTYSHLVGSNKQLQDKYTFDGLHMTAESYQVITSLLKPYVDSLA